MLTGYSSPPTGYEEKTTEFLKQAVQLVGAKNIAIVTSPTATKGSIDAIGTMLAQDSGAGIMHITPEQYLSYVDIAQMPERLDVAAFKAHPIYVVPNSAYTDASANASNAILVTGGRDTALEDTKKALLKGNAVFVAPELSPSAAWAPNPKFQKDNTKPPFIVDNAAAYLREQVSSLWITGTLKYEERGGITKEFLTQYADQINFVKTPQAFANLLVNHTGNGLEQDAVKIADVPVAQNIGSNKPALSYG